MKYLKMAAFFFIELALFFIAYFTEVYKSLFYTSLFTSITSLPLFSILKSFLILTCMSVPLFIVIYLINLKYLKISKKDLFVVNGLFILVCLVVAELLIQFT